MVVEQLTVRYGEFIAVNCVSLEVNGGETIGLIGPNGAGKSTLISAISGSVHVASGSISLDGVDLTASRPARLRHLGLARTFQHPELFDSMTVEDNLLVAGNHESKWSQILASTVGYPAQRRRETAGRSYSRKVLDDMGAGQWGRVLAADIPQGVQRLVGVARALAGGETKMLLLDEPAAGLDSEERHVLMHAIAEMQSVHGFGVLLVEHDLGLVMEFCQRLCVMEQGSRIAYGDPESVRHDSSVIDSYIGS